MIRRAALTPTTISGGFSKLVQDYLGQHPEIHPFSNGVPSLELLIQSAAKRTFTQEKREVLVNALKHQYAKAKLAVPNEVELLLADNARTITTGHQLCLAGGPMYFFFKILSVVKLSEILTHHAPEFRWIPVFWMASEDHDFAEINHTYWNKQRIEWTRSAEGAVGVMSNEGLNEVIEAIAAIDETFNDSVIQRILTQAYTHPNWADATRYFVHEVFAHYTQGKQQPIIIDGNDAALKRLMVPYFKADVLEQKYAPVVRMTTHELESMGYSPQVNARDINVFYLNEKSRTRIIREGSQWKVADGEKSWTHEELLSEIEHCPENFSPNVILRPLFQEVILPNVAYIGGPGEIAYWLQLKAMFDASNVDFPALVLRDNAIITSERTLQRMEKLEVDTESIWLDKDLIVKRWIQNSGAVDVSFEKQQLASIFESLSQKAKAIDPTLEPAAKGEGQKQLTGIENLEKRMIKAMKAKEELRIQQLEKVQSELFPDGIWMERRESILPLLIRHENLLNDLFEQFNPLELGVKWMVHY